MIDPDRYKFHGEAGSNIVTPFFNGKPIQTWFTARELAGMKLAGFPQYKRAINRRASCENWRFRKCGGRGGGKEFSFDSLPEKMRVALVKKKPELFGIAPGSRSAPPKIFSPPENFSHEILWRLFSQTSGKERDVAQKRLEVLNRVLDLESAGVKKIEAVKNLAGQIGISSSTIYNWAKRIDGFNRHDWLPALAAKWSRLRDHKEYSIETWDFFKGDYLREEAPQASACYDRLKRVAEKENWTYPSLKTLIRRLYRELPRETITLAREGKRGLDRMYPSQIRDKSHLEALECVDMDGHKFDVFTRSPDGSITRPVGIFSHDVHSSKILAYRVDRSENKDLVRLTFADTVEKFGIPRKLYLDNSRAFASKWLTGGAKNRYRFKIKSEDPTGIMKSVGCEIHWVKPYRGQSKPIERSFRDFAENVSKHPAFSGAYTGKDPTAKPENYGSRAIDLETFLKVLDEEVKAHNAREGRRSPVCNGRSFDTVFFESYSRATIRKITKEQKGLLLLAAEGAKVSRYDGSICLDGNRNRYWNERLPQYAGQKLIVRLDPQNLHAGIFVYDLNNSYLCSAECIQPVGFTDSGAAREHARLKKHRAKAVKRILESERRMSALEVAARLSGTSEESPEIPSPKIIEGLFRDNIERPRQEKAEIEANFESAMASIEDQELEKINRRFAVHAK